MRLWQLKNECIFDSCSIRVMKKIMSRILVLVSLAAWTVFAIASDGKHDLKCRHEWKAGFDTVSAEPEDEAEENQANSTSIDYYLPGSLQNFILQ